METNMSSLTAQVNLCFDQIVKLKGKPKEGDNVFGEGSHKGKHLEDEEDPTNHFSFSDHSHNLMPHLPKVDLNKFDGSNPTSWVDQMEHYFSLHAIADELLKLKIGVLYLDREHW
jgi:hypothetical protein